MRRTARLALVASLLAPLAAMAAEDSVPGPEAAIHAYANTLDGALSREVRSKQLVDYRGNYLGGLLGNGSQSGDEGARTGHAAGALFRQRHPQRLDEALAYFGYRYIEARGALGIWFEHSAFFPSRPTGIAQARQNGWWYADTIGWIEQPRELRREQTSCADGVVKGYLTPRGVYGQFGNWEYQIVPISFDCRDS